MTDFDNNTQPIASASGWLFPARWRKFVMIFSVILFALYVVATILVFTVEAFHLNTFQLINDFLFMILPIILFIHAKTCRTSIYINGTHLIGRWSYSKEEARIEYWHISSVKLRKKRTLEMQLILILC